MKIKNKNELLQFIKDKINEDIEQSHKFRPGIDEVPVSGVQISTENIVDVIDTVLDGWFTEGERCKQFSKSLTKYFDRSPSLVTLCNSGSSASLLSMAVAEEYFKHSDSHGYRRTVLTCSTGFPTTVAPILQLGYDIHFIDINTRTLNVDMDQLMDCIYGENFDTAGVILAHTLGFPFDAEEVAKACKRFEIFFIEDCCDAISAKWNGKYVGSFGDIATLSFFPAHHITTGEGGAVISHNGRLHRIVQSLSNWGRDCWCKPGEQDTCNKRFGWKLGELPEGYDHKYIFSRLGYNLKMTELQAALGLSQIQNLEDVTAARQDNYWYLRHRLLEYNDHIWTWRDHDKSEPSPFGFPITVRSTKFTARELIAHLESKKIRTRPIFAGNLIRQPMMKRYGNRISGYTGGSDYIMDHSFWVGCHPGLNQDHLDYMIETIEEFIKK